MKLEILNFNSHSSAYQLSSLFMFHIRTINIMKPRAYVDVPATVRGCDAKDLKF